MKSLPSRLRCTAELALAWVVAAFVSLPAAAAQDFELRTISSRPEVVSGGDVLVEAIVPLHAPWNVELNGRDVTESFRLPVTGGRQTALLDGLRDGENTLRLRSNGRVRVKLAILNHPRSGPIFSGPHQEPFICQTILNGLGPALDSDCSADTVVQYYYKSTQPVKTWPLPARQGASMNLDPGFKLYEVAGPRPSDIAQTVTSEGNTVDFIVRREVGTINRAVYEIQFLHQPGQPLPSPWTARGQGWNGRLVYTFGAGCNVGYRQGVLDESMGGNPIPLLALGYAYATSTLNIFANSCNDRTSAETLSMVKEYFIERYGEPAHTIGSGGSGGAMQLHLIAQNYPGLLDGIIVGASFPDVLTYIPPTTDCALLRHAFEKSRRRWAEDQQTAVSGFATWRTCMKERFLDPKNCDSSIPAQMVYDRVTNPQGVRCDIYSNQINQLGRDPQTGFAGRPLDNTGIQYGLLAFNSGRIDADQFVDLNERVGGYDDDGNIIASRMQAAPETLRVAYEKGLVLTGGGGLSQVPIIDWHSYTDDQGDNHVRLRALETRSRLIAAVGSADNQVILITPAMRFTDTDPDSAEFLQLRRNLVQLMDRWLDGIAADHADGTAATKVVRNRPSELSEGCWQVDGKRIVERASYEGAGRCNELYPPHKDPRVAAGAPVSGAVLKCALKPIRPGDYAQPLSEDQLGRLRKVFPDGVCDYSRPGVGQEVISTVWQPFRDDSRIVGQAHP